MLLAVSGFIFIVLSLFFLNNWWKNRDLPPGPWNLPILGYLPRLNPEAPYLTFSKLSKKYGCIYGLYLGKVYTIVISDVKLMKKIFMKDAASGPAPLHFTHGIFKNKGIIHVGGDLWKDQRKLTCHFLKTVGAWKTSPNKEKLESTIMKYVMEFIQDVRNQGDRVILDPEEILPHYLGSVVSMVILGKSWSREDEKWQDVLDLYSKASKLLPEIGVINFLPILRFLPKYQAITSFFTKATLRVHDIFTEIIQEANNNQSTLFRVFLNEREKRHFPESYTNQQLLYLLSDMFGAGLDTTISTFQWFLLFMGVHQQIQRKLRLELDDVLCGKSPNCGDLSALPYMEATMAEVQRIRPIVPTGIPHGTLEEIKIDNFKIPKDTMIIPLQWVIHLDPEIWEKPETFQPERFLDSEGKFNKPECFIPFQTGKRVCIGEELASKLLFLFSTTILQNFKIEIEDPSTVDLTGVCDITLRPRPHKLIFINLNKN